MSDKVQPGHLERAAYIYIRQSTIHQVRHNRERQRRQYGLGDRARKLRFQRVEVVDDDLGRSGSGAVERPGFDRLVGAVCHGQVGAVLAVEASRLARNNRDWHHLVDLCALTDTLVIDHDGIYNPRQLNDRLLLGLKGTMSEFELGLLRQRSQEALRQMIARGEVLTEMPVGYIRTADRRCEMAPDRRVQSAVRGVFRKFRELGSARQVLLWYRQERIPLPSVHHGRFGREVHWALPVYNRILGILTNPTYAGAFVHGRRRTKTVVAAGRARRTSGHRVPRERWPVLIRDHHAGYISWEEYLRNQSQLEANAGMRGAMSKGAAKSGPALLAGLLRCARCGRRLHVGYSGIGGRVPRYFCRGAHINHGAEGCISFGGLPADRAVVDTVLDAVQPAGVEAALRACEEQAHREDEARQSLRLTIDQARYDAERARRQYDAVEPENRLVAAELEARWNAALDRLAELEQRLRELPAAESEPDAETRQRLLELGQDLHAVWHHAGASPALKKRILRTVVEEIVVDVTEEPFEIQVTIHWAGGVHTFHRVKRRPPGRHRWCTDREVVDLVRDLAKVCPDQHIAAILNRLGYRTGAGNAWKEGRVASLRSYRKIPAFSESEGRTWLTMTQASRALEVSPPVVRRLLRLGTLPGRQVVPCAPWMIRKEDLSLPAVVAAVRAIQKGRRAPRSAPEQSTLPMSSTT